MTTTRSWTPLAGAAHAVALEVLLHGPLPRSELARRLDLSPGSLTRLTKPLLAHGLLVETGESVDAHPGRPTRPLDIRPDAHHFLGVKLTADTAYGVVTTMRARVLAEEQHPLPGTDPDSVVLTVAELARSLRARTPPITAAGISLGGQVSGNSLVTSAGFLGWSDVDLGTRAEAALDGPVVVDNDLLSLTRAEQWFGAARDSDHFAVLTIGEGVGYSLVVHGRLLAGPDAGVGLLGHFPLDPWGPVCSQGHQGCAESMLTSGAIRNRAALALGVTISYDELLDLVERGHPAATRIATDSARALGRLTAAIGNITMPEKIILSGDGIRLAQVAPLAMTEACTADRNCYATPLDIGIQPAGFTEWARGAAATAIQTFVLGT